MSMKRVLLTVSFGTSYRDNCEKTIGAVEQALKAAYPDYEIRRAFTSGMIRDVWRSRDGICIDSVSDALGRLAEEGVDTVIVQPTHMMNGEEHEAMLRAAEPYKSSFRKFSCGTPVLTSIDDYRQIALLLMEEIPEWRQKDTAVVLMGHGTHHHANSAYAALEYRLQDEGAGSVFVGTVEGYPDLGAVVRKIKKNGFKKVVLYPLMIAAGDHVNHDMAGNDDDSWKETLKREGLDVTCVLRGLGEYEGIRDIFVKHAGAAMDRI